MAHATDWIFAFGAEYLVGFVLALAVAALASVTGLHRERGFYPTMLIVIAFFYVLFAVMASSPSALGIESVVAGGFLVVALLGFKTNLWLIAAGLVGHGIFDLLHHFFIVNPGVPRWWPGFCGSFDVIIGGWMVALLLSRPKLFSERR